MDLENFIILLLSKEEERKKFQSWRLAMLLMMHSTNVYLDNIDDTIKILMQSIEELTRLKEWRRLNNLSVRAFYIFITYYYFHILKDFLFLFSAEIKFKENGSINHSKTLPLFRHLFSN